MLIGFTLKNYGVYRDRIRLDLTKDIGEEHPENVLGSASVKSGVLNGAVVYGDNASGKTTLIEAIALMRRMALGKPPVANPFRGTKDAPSEMSIRFTDDIDVLFEYSISFDDRIVSESASFSPNGRTTRIFVRDGRDVEAGSKFQDLSGLKAEDDVSFLCTAAENGNEVCARMQDWFSRCVLIAPEYSDEKFRVLMEIVSRNPELKADLVVTMRNAGYSIRDLGRDEITYLYPDSGEQYTIPYTGESHGTLNAIFTFYTMYMALKKGCVLVSDCPGGWMAPELFRYMLERFRAEENPSKAQFLTVRADRMLMTTEVLRRDQILINGRNRLNGTSSLHAVSEFKGIRANADIQKEYDSGRFDNFPEDGGTESIDPEL